MALPLLLFLGVSGVSTALACNQDSLGLLSLGTDPQGWVGLGWVGGPAFDPVDGWGVVGVEKYFWVESGFMWQWALLQDGLVLEVGYRCGKGDLLQKMLHFAHCFFCLGFFLSYEAA